MEKNLSESHAHNTQAAGNDNDDDTVITDLLFLYTSIQSFVIMVESLFSFVCREQK